MPELWKYVLFHYHPGLYFWLISYCYVQGPKNTDQWVFSKKFCIKYIFPRQLAYLIPKSFVFIEHGAMLTAIRFHLAKGAIWRSKATFQYYRYKLITDQYRSCYCNDLLYCQLVHTVDCVYWVLVKFS